MDPGPARPLPGGTWPGPVPRPDGRLQLGLGPGAWLVQGWAPGRSAHDPSTVLVHGLASPAPGREHGPGQFVVLGDGELAMRLRASEPQEPERDGSEPDQDRSEPDQDGSEPERDGSEFDRDGRAGVGPSGAGSGPAVVLVSTHLVPVGTARRADLAGRPVLPVVLQSERIVVGPWTGMPGAPCLHCLDLHRRDRDQAWPAVAAAFDDPSCRVDPPEHGAAVLDLTRCLVLLLLGAVRQGRPPATGLGYEIGERPPHLVIRGWTAHPACPWHEVGR